MAKRVSAPRVNTGADCHQHVCTYRERLHALSIVVNPRWHISCTLSCTSLMDVIMSV